MKFSCESFDGVPSALEFLMQFSSKSVNQHIFCCRRRCWCKKHIQCAIFSDMSELHTRFMIALCIVEKFSSHIFAPPQQQPPPLLSLSANIISASTMTQPIKARNDEIHSLSRVPLLLMKY
jgi:hypothetical protein